LSDRTATIVAAQFKRDYGPIHKAFGGRLPLDRITAIETSNRRALEENHGALQSFEVLGSIAAEEGAETYVRLQCQRGTPVMCFAWEGAHLRGIRMLQALSTSRTFLPASETDFASFSFAAPTPMRVQFVMEKDGTVTGLALTSGTGKVVARKTVQLPQTPGSSPRQAKRSYTQILQELGAFLDKQAAPDQFSGGVPIARDGKPLLEQAYGLANRRRHAPVRPRLAWPPAAQCQEYPADYHGREAR
jgi:hypothetical protein